MTCRHNNVYDDDDLDDVCMTAQKPSAAREVRQTAMIVTFETFQQKFITLHVKRESTLPTTKKNLANALDSNNRQMKQNDTRHHMIIDNACVCVFNSLAFHAQNACDSLQTFFFAPPA